MAKPTPPQTTNKPAGDDKPAGYGGYYYGYGYGGSGYGNGYGYGGYGYGDGENNQRYSRTLKDYLLILRERIWYLIVTFFIVFTGAILYTMNSTPIYESVATIQVLRRNLTPFELDRSDPNSVVGNSEDFNTQLKIVESGVIVQAVSERLKDDELKRFMAPYEDVKVIGAPITPQMVLSRNRKIVPVRMSMIIQIVYSHPDARVAANIANLFAEEYINYNLRLSTSDAMKAVEDLRVRVDQQRRRVEELENQLQDYRRKYDAVSLDPKNDIDTQELLNLNTIVTTCKRSLDEAESLWLLVQQYKQTGRDLTELPVISGQPAVASQMVQVSNLAMNMASLSKRYKEKHPQMIEMKGIAAEADKILQENIDTAVQKVYSDYLAAKENYDASQKRLIEKRRETIDLAKIKIEFDSLTREVEIARSLHQAMVTSMSGYMARVSLIGQAARTIDKAGEAMEPSSPKVMLNLLVGAVAGLALGMVLVFVLAFFDDRIKSAYDIESEVGLPLLGIIPRIRSQNSSEKALAVASNVDRQVTESFRSIYSALKINDISSKAKVILFTSTLPSEGKSFVATNMALTSALQGERVIVVDCDLRVPNIAKSVGIDGEKGVISVLESTATLDDCIQKNVYPNLDVLPAGGRAKNPTQLINSREFSELLETLRGRYDRVYVDSPPVGAVSDSITMLPLVDGVIYVIKFNNVKRKTAKLNVRRVMDANVPIFGAILNQISVASANYYYNSYYDKSYQNYYLDDDAESGDAASQDASEDAPADDAAAQSPEASADGADAESGDSEKKE